MKIPVGYVKNLNTGRIHPIFFQPDPSSTGAKEDEGKRFCSYGCHLEGFDTLEEAQTFVGSISAYEDIGIVWEKRWKNSEVPSVTTLFLERYEET